MRLHINRLCVFVFRSHNGETQTGSFTSNGLRSYGVRMGWRASRHFFTLIAVNQSSMVVNAFRLCRRVLPLPHYSSPMKRCKADMILSSLAEGAFTPFIAQSKKNGRLGARDSRSSVGMSMCHSFLSSSQ